MKYLQGEFAAVQAHFVQQARLAKEGELPDRTERMCSSRNSDDNEKEEEARLSRTRTSSFRPGIV